MSILYCRFYKKPLRALRSFAPLREIFKDLFGYYLKMESNMSIIDNLKSVKERIAKAALRSGRKPEDVKLIAVTKTISTERIEEAIKAGVSIIGENRIQEAMIKHSKIKLPVTWHLIGHLQRNKVNKALEITEFIHSIDSIRLAEAISKRALTLNKIINILLEVNTSGEESKFGFVPDKVRKILPELAQLKGIKICGLMTIGAFLPDPEDVRPCFILLRKLNEELKKLNIEGVELEHLSMGMSNDFEIAIEEGATLVRVGTAIFGIRG